MLDEQAALSLQSSQCCAHMTTIPNHCALIASLILSLHPPMGCSAHGWQHMASPWWFCDGPGVQQVPMSLLERYWKKRDGCFAPRRSQPGWVATGILAFVFGTWNLGLFEILKVWAPHCH